MSIFYFLIGCIVVLVILFICFKLYKTLEKINRTQDLLYQNESNIDKKIDLLHKEIDDLFYRVNRYKKNNKS